MAPPLQVADPKLAVLRDDSCASVRCVVARAIRHRSGVLTAKAAGRVWCGGGSKEGARDVRGRVSAYATTSGELLGSAQLEAHATCLALVETVRPTAPLRQASRRVTAEGFGCELYLWVGMADGRIAVLSANELQVRVVLTGHRGALSCICTPGAPPSSPGQGAAIVLSAAEDWGMRLWDARKTDCLRSVPGGGSVLRAVLPVWTPEGERPERCRVWSAADDGTLCVWEPRLSGKGQGTPPQSVALPAACIHLAAASDGRLVCGAAGADGVLVFDGNVRLRARLRCEASGTKGDAFVAVLVVGRGRQLWSAARDGGVVLWQRASGGPPGQPPEWAWHVCRRLDTAPLSGLCTAGAAQVWGGARDGSVLVWLSEAAAAEAADGVSRRALAGGGSGGGGGGGGGGGVHEHGLAFPLLRLLRVAMRELHDVRGFLSATHAQVKEGWAALEAVRHQATDAVRRQVARAAAAEAERDDALERLTTMRAKLGAAGAEKQQACHRARDTVPGAPRHPALPAPLIRACRYNSQAIALRGRQQSEVARLRKAEAELAQRGKDREAMARQLAEARVLAQQSRQERDKAQVPSAPALRLRRSTRPAPALHPHCTCSAPALHRCCRPRRGGCTASCSRRSGARPSTWSRWCEMRPRRARRCRRVRWSWRSGARRRRGRAPRSR